MPWLVGGSNARWCKAQCSIRFVNIRGLAWLPLQLPCHGRIHIKNTRVANKPSKKSWNVPIGKPSFVPPLDSVEHRSKGYNPVSIVYRPDSSGKAPVQEYKIIVFPVKRVSSKVLGKTIARIDGGYTESKRHFTSFLWPAMQANTVIKHNQVLF